MNDYSVQKDVYVMALSDNDKNSIKKNAFMNVLLTVSSVVFPIVSFPYASRVLSPSGIGKVSFGTSFIAYFSMIAQLGIPTYGVRACAKVRDDKYKLTRTVHELLAINLIMNVVTYSILIIAILSFSKIQENEKLIILLSSTIILNSIGVEWLYKALEKYSYITIRSIAFKIIGLVALFLLVRNQDDYIMYGAITIFASSASNILNFINVRKFLYFQNVGNYNFKRHINSVLTFFAMACATTVYTNLDIIMLGFMTKDNEVGYYSAAVKIKGILVAVVTSVGAVILPRASYYIENGDLKSFRIISNKALRFVLFAAIPTVIFFIIYAKEGIIFLSGGAFEPSVHPMQVIMPTVLFIGITNIFGIQMLVPLGREKQVLLSEIIGAIIDMVLNVFLIPLYGALGAAIGTLVAEIAVLLYQLNAIKEERRYFSIRRSALRYIVFAGVSAFVCLWVKLLNMTSFVSLCLSGLSFFGCYLLSLYFVKDEVLLMLFRKKTSIDMRGVLDEERYDE